MGNYGRMLPGGDLADITSQLETYQQSLMEFMVGPSDTQGTLIEGSSTPKPHRGLEVLYLGAAPLSAQMEHAWLSDDDETLQDLILLDKALKQATQAPES